MPTQERRNLVFILGAGYSARAGLPVMRDFMPVARDRGADYEHREHRFAKYFKALCDFQVECRKSAWILSRDWNNIEELYTQADLLQLVEGSPEAKGLCRNISWSIWDIYRRHATNEVPPLREVLLSIKNKNDRPVVITTNYDVLCEIGVGKSMHDPVPEGQTFAYYYPGFELPWNVGSRILKTESSIGLNPEFPPRLPRVPIPIIKLHGSVNWFRGTDEHKIVASTVLGSGMAITDDVNSVSFDERQFAQTAFETTPLMNPMIIPPMLGKSTQHSVISAQWSAAIDAIAGARHICVIGYSFPQTDAFMIRLIAEGLRQNQDIRSFTIVDRQNVDDWRGRITEMFPQTARRTTVGFISSDAVEFMHQFASMDYEGRFANAVRIV